MCVGGAGGHCGGGGSGITRRCVERDEGLIVISPGGSKGYVHTSLVDHTATWRIEGTRVVSHDAIDGRTPYTFQIGIGTFIA